MRRAGLDYWPRVAPRVWPDWAAFERALPSLGTPFLFTARAPRRFQDVAYSQPAVLIFGRESVGLDPQILARHAASTVAIPMLDPRAALAEPVDVGRARALRGPPPVGLGLGARRR